ncbi:MAG: hypothetical protein ACOCR6_01740 [archaeon]
MHHDNTDANGWGYRGGDGHIIGESMPGTVGDAEHALHDRQGQTPAVNEDVEVPGAETEEGPETVETGGVTMDGLVKQLRE